MPNSEDSESERFLKALIEKYKNEQEALLTELMDKWKYFENPHEILHNLNSWHGLDQKQFDQVFNDFIRLTELHQKETEENLFE